MVHVASAYPPAVARLPPRRDGDRRRSAEPGDDARNVVVAGSCRFGNQCCSLLRREPNSTCEEAGSRSSYFVPTVRRTANAAGAASNSSASADGSGTGSYETPSYQVRLLAPMAEGRSSM
jgi:hypothetical protein